jgi:hypothetical protein
MRKLSEVEIINLNKVLQLETSGVTKARMMIPAINDSDLRRAAETAILSSEVRIKGIQQFIVENNIINSVEVH